jgi:hypothetical protein
METRPLRCHDGVKDLRLEVPRAVPEVAQEGCCDKASEFPLAVPLVRILAPGAGSSEFVAVIGWTPAIAARNLRTRFMAVGVWGL